MAATKHIAMDCEMVGAVVSGQSRSIPARVAIVNQQGEVLYDKFVQPQFPVTDYRTSVSGIRPQDLVNGVNFETVRTEVANMLNNRVLIGHALEFDLDVLNLKHPANMIRDTSKYPPLGQLVGNPTPSLQDLALRVLNKRIQVGQHNPVEDARAAMEIYNVYKNQWQ